VKSALKKPVKRFWKKYQGMDIVEVAPRLDCSSITLFAARKIVTECWGHYFRKIKNLNSTK